MDSPKTKGNIRNCAARRNQSGRTQNGFPKNKGKHKKLCGSKKSVWPNSMAIGEPERRANKQLTKVFSAAAGGDETKTLGSCPRQRAGRTWRLSVIRTAGCAQEKCSWHFEIIQRECVKSCGLRKNMRAEKNRPANSSNDWTLVITCAWHYHKSQTADNTWAENYWKITRHYTTHACCYNRKTGLDLLSAILKLQYTLVIIHINEFLTSKLSMAYDIRSLQTIYVIN